MENLFVTISWEVAKHLKTWVTNLRRAKEDRKKEVDRSAEASDYCQQRHADLHQ